jgi:putative hydrolase of the HAD superfamily
MKAVVFDFGNVIAFFDHQRTLGKLTPYTDMSADAMLAAVYGADLEDAFESGRMSGAEFLRHFRELCRLTCDDAFLHAACADIFWANEPVCALVPGLKAAGYKLVLGSNTNEIHAAHFRRQFADTLRHFDGLVLSHEAGVRKPRRGFFDNCQRLAGCAAHECVFIDDLAANVAGATACGWHGIVYRDDTELQGRLSDLGVRWHAA